ncbi:MAG: DUF2817 domain-containing protein [Bdellovibrionaceae bacterium]|nr:DUF2817 domain-containing protein [Pseudobdellovibrionaceae bacterium]
MKVRVFGHSSFNLPIVGYEFAGDGPEVLVLGGIHGDEYEGVATADGLLESLLQDNPFRLSITLIPRANPDGVLLRTRSNGQGVDLNRNLPTKDWSPEIKNPRYNPGPRAGSEIENQVLMRLLEEKKPVFVLSLHSWHPVLNVNGPCRPQAEAIARLTGYKIDDDIGYPTPGCLGTYAGLERPHATLTYEIERGQSVPEILKIHVPAVRAALQATERIPS